MSSFYIRRSKIGEGAYAVIYKSEEYEGESDSKIVKETILPMKRVVAIKKIKNRTAGIDGSAIREIKALRAINDKYVIRIHDVFFHNDSLNIVLEHVRCSLESIIKNKNIIFMPSDIKAWMYMIVRGVFAMHKKFFIHRDIKPSNILIDSQGVIKIADLGLARSIGLDHFTPTVATRWYRSPELLFGSNLYGFCVDIWSIGCIFAELFLRVPYLPGNDDINQLDTIFRALGTPTEKEWPQMKMLPDYIELPNYPKTPLNALFTGASKDALDLMGKMFIYNPPMRITTKNILQHEYFKNSPKPTRRSDIFDGIKE
ncbi:Protein kinase [Spraguea lophii 42_110]|uniref:[RNA-polymerase]-subunit kinase n=1 Tax=Spraguea lophii (strain 42_110) TaxID=1358809 RepID=S7XLU3_SPRLO|nr:Protein kinase [Spraguea lophii 42_110]